MLEKSPLQSFSWLWMEGNVGGILNGPPQKENCINLHFNKIKQMTIEGKGD